MPASTDPERRRVLVVDDDPFIRRVLRRMLDKTCEVVELPDGRQALQALEVAPDAFDLVLCDLEMPDMGGLELWMRLAERHPAVLSRIVFMSGGTMLESHLDFLEQRRPHVLDKPFSAADMRELVAARLGVYHPMPCSDVTARERAA